MIRMVRMEFLVGIMVVLLWFINVKATTGEELPIAKSGCADRCGKVKIPYPFGIGPNCYANQSYSLTCNSSKPFLTSLNLEVLDIYMGIRQASTLLVSYPITKSDNCPIKEGIRPYLNLEGTPFSFSSSTNRFIGVGCNTVAKIFSPTSTKMIAQCISICDNGTSTNTSWDGICYGVNCCQTYVPPSLKAVNISVASIGSSLSSDCSYGFLVDTEWFGANFSHPYVVETMESVPVNLIWKTDEKCYGFKSEKQFSEWAQDCLCGNIDQDSGNPYLQNGCPAHFSCPGSVERRCSFGSRSCENICIIKKSNRNIKAVFIGLGSGFGGLFMIMGAWSMKKIIRRRNKAKLKKKFFKRNGGLLLQKQLCSADQVYVEKTKLFSSNELETATDHYNENRVLGRGGQGTVYKGMLIDGKIVAVKKSKIMDEVKLDEFVNEVVILSQINHRNVVKLHGCCLETEVPLLVYDFISNGTLSEYIHHQENEDFSLTWDVRLRIASEVAGALTYLHSSASIPIYHRDIKSSNILLDDKYRAKVADFGTSRSLTIDQTHMTTRVQGTFGYLDPEFYQSSQYTAKSDVYSFGVVLVELLTGHKAVLPTTFVEGRSLATYFMLGIKENRLFDILDARVVREGNEGEIVGVAFLANRCLNLNGRKRPTMKEVAMELEVIKTTHGGSPQFQPHYEEIDNYDITQPVSPFDRTASNSVTTLVGR